MEETTFFERGGVKVTNARFIVDGQTFAMNGVTSVKRGERPASKVGPIIVALVGVGALFAGSVASMLFGVLLLAGTAFWWTKLKPTLTVLLSSASGEAQALSSQDAPYIGSVVEALNNALVQRG